MLSNEINGAEVIRRRMAYGELKENNVEIISTWSCLAKMKYFDNILREERVMRKEERG